MNEQEFGSDTDDSDFCPENLKDDDADSESMDEKADAFDKIDEDSDKPKKKQKRKKSRKVVAANKEVFNEVEQNSNKALDPDEEKRREEALWAEFLGETETTPSTSSSTVTSSSKEQNIPKQQKATPSQSRASPPTRQSPPKIFEFAGEEVIVNETKPSASENSSNEITKVAAGVKRSGGGLSSVLNQISKKNKLSILQKTKIDWDGFKTNEGISEELQTHNRGRDGFLERRDFLERTDLRQFEIEKNMRQTTRRSHK